MYWKYLKKTFRILPQKYRQKTLFYLFLSFVNLLLDLFSLAIVIPLIFIIMDKKTFASSGYFTGFLDYSNFYNDPWLLTAIIILLIVIFIAKNSLSIKIVSYQTQTCFALASEISGSFIRNYIYHDFIEFKKQAQSDVLRNSIEIPNEFIVYVIIALNTILSELILLSFIFVTGLLINTPVTLYLFIIFAVSIWLVQGIGRHKIQLINDNLAKDYSRNVSNLFNLMDGFFEIKTAGREEYFLNRFTRSNKAVNTNYATLYARNMITPRYIEVVIICIIGALIVLYNSVSQSDGSGLLYFSFLAAAAMKVIPSLNKIITAFLNFKSHLFTIDIIDDKLAKVYSAKQGDASPVVFEKNLQLKNISFSYNDKPLLQDINLEIKKGEIITIIGDSGIGKSTLLNIITQLIKPDSGTIYWDDSQINNKSNHLFLKLLSYVPQTSFLLEGTILENITLGRENYNKSDLLKLLADFDMEKTINMLPQKLATFIGNNGHYLSGGQKQRMALIRALLNQPQFLILDEATNQLEKELEMKILKKLKKEVVQNNMTLLLVSHHAENSRLISDHVFQLTREGIKELNQPE